MTIFLIVMLVLGLPFLTWRYVKATEFTKEAVREAAIEMFTLAVLLGVVLSGFFLIWGV